MSRSGPQKEKIERSSGFSHNDCDDLTCARTRPCSFEEIILRRKNRNLSEDVKEGAMESETMPGEDIVKKISDHFKSEIVHRCDENSSYGFEKHKLDQQAKSHFKKKEEKDDVKKGSFLKERCGHNIKSEIRLKDNLESELGSRSRGDRTEKGGKGRSKRDDQLSDISDTKSEKRHPQRSSSKDKYDKSRERDIKDRYGELSRGRPFIDRYEERKREKKGSDRPVERVRENLGIDSHEERGRERTVMEKYQEKDREKAGRDKYEERGQERTVMEKYEEKGREKAGREKYEERGSEKNGNTKSGERSREKYDIEGKRKHQSEDGRKYDREDKRKHEDDEKYEDRNAAKKHDSGRRRDLDSSGRRERKESPKHYDEESRLKRRRSRSQEHVIERHRRSISLSPRCHKHTSSYHGKEHVESLHSSKDRSGRQHFDTDRIRMSNNGTSSHHRRHSGFTSGLGGYSPRKRRTDVAIRTPSPTKQSPDKRSAGSDLPIVRTDSIISGSRPSVFPLSNQSVLSHIPELAGAVTGAPNSMTSLFGALPNGFSSKNTAAVDSVHLTEATRPMRRLYVENLPESATEKALLECVNTFMMSSGINHIQGSQPCISCIINKQKGQALMEFLTPEDASSALSFDGSSFAGSILKVRRPKDFGVGATREPQRSVAAVEPVTMVDGTSDSLKASPQKVFIGGISKTLSSEMVMEIAAAFGPVKSYHFEVNGGQPYAVLEYVDQSIVPKACAGLNGMKLGGEVVTVVEAVQGASSEGNTGSSLRGIPEHAKPLLEQPTHVIKLKNVFIPEAMSTLTESELEEVLEDVRIECARFGTVKSLNVVRCSNFCVTAEACENNDLNMSPKAPKVDETSEGNNANGDESAINAVDFGADLTVPAEHLVCEDECVADSQALSNQLNASKDPSDYRDIKMPFESFAHDENTLENNVEFQDEKKVAHIQLESHDIKASEEQSEGHVGNISNNQSETTEEKAANAIQVADSDLKEMTPEDEMKTEEVTKQDVKDDLAGNGHEEKDYEAKGEDKEQYCNLDHIFEPGCIFVEYKRTEASCMAAHCLHGRSFDDRIVTVEYVPLDLYRARFST